MPEQNPDQMFETLDNFDLENVEAFRPCIREGAYTFRLEKLELVEHKSKQGHNLNISLRLSQPAPNQDPNGREVQPGLMVFDGFSITKTEKYDPAERLAQMQLCFLGKQQKGGWREMIGQEGVVRVKFEDDPTYGKRNRIASFVSKAGARGAPPIPSL